MGVNGIGHRHIRIKGATIIAKVLVVFCYGSSRWEIAGE